MGAGRRARILAQLLRHSSRFSLPHDPFFFGADLHGRFLQMLKLDPMLPFALWVAEEVCGVCLRGLCQISELWGWYWYVASEGCIFSFDSLPFPHPLNLHIPVCHCGHHLPTPEAKPTEEGGERIGKKIKAHLNRTGRST